MSFKNYIVQISDLHLFGDKNKKINGANSYKNLENVFNSLTALKEKPELIIVTGDLSQDCTFESYQHLANLLNKSDIKYYLLPGNHDDVSVVNKVFELNWEKDTVEFSFDFKDWFFVFIDTSIYPEDSGSLSLDQLLSFKNILKLNKNKKTIVFMHHHPILINSPLMNTMILKENEKFNNVIKENQQVKAVLFGHVHQVFEKTINETFYASCPATCYQIQPGCENFTVEKTIPGYRLLDLEKDKVTSRVVWVE